jgi:hypothetical protein
VDLIQLLLCAQVLTYVIPFTQDYIRMMIHSRKMNPKTLEEDGFEDVKVKYYTMMVSLHVVDRNTWEVCQDYYKVGICWHVRLCYPAVVALYVRLHVAAICIISWQTSDARSQHVQDVTYHTHTVPL